MVGVFAAASVRAGRKAAPGDAGPSGKRLDAPCRVEAAARRGAIRRPPGASKRQSTFRSYGTGLTGLPGVVARSALPRDVGHRARSATPPRRKGGRPSVGQLGSSRALRRSADAPHRPSRRACRMSRFAPSNRFPKAGTCSGPMSPHRSSRFDLPGRTAGSQRKPQPWWEMRACPSAALIPLRIPAECRASPDDMTGRSARTGARNQRRQSSRRAKWPQSRPRRARSCGRDCPS